MDTYKEMQLAAIEAAKAGDLTLSLSLFDKVLEAQPRLYQAWCNRANVLDDLGREQEALTSFDRALQIYPAYETALANRKIVQKKITNQLFNQGLDFDNGKQLDAALGRYEQALAIDPMHSDANLNAALVLEALGRLDEAAARFIEAERIEPGYVDGLNRAGDILRTSLGKHQEALACYERSLAIATDQPSIRLNRGGSLLAIGQLAAGWEALELRATHGGPFMGWFDFPQPQWRGEPLAGKRILLWCEQGYGDTFQFCRYVHDVCQLGAQVYLLAPQALQRLLTNSFLPAGVTLVLGSAQAAPFDFHCPLMSLPLAFHTYRLEDIPVKTAYLFANQSTVHEWQARLAAHTARDQLRIGLVWASSQRPELPAQRDARALPLSQFEVLKQFVQAIGAQIFSLQRDQPLSQLHELVAAHWGGPVLVDCSSDLTDWEETAACISHLDLVISCDTAVAHLAAAMGKPTWVLLHDSPCWRWLQNRDDSPWYPTVRLFRQAERGNWGEVVERVKSALVQWGAIEAAKRGDLTDALALFDLQISMQPDSHQAWGNRANVLDDLGRVPEALESFDRALQIHPTYETAISNRQAVQKRLADQLFNRGVVLDNDKELDAALACYERALSLHPAHSAANLNAALILEELGRLEEAVTRFIASEKIEPGYVDGLNRAGDILGASLGRHKEALVCYERSLAMQPEQDDIRWNTAHSLLALGQYQQGWRAYDLRTANGDKGLGWIDFRQPRWRGESIVGKRLLLWCEQGFGDVFQFCRYVPIVRDQGATVFLLVHPNIERLFRAVFESEGVHVVLGSALALPFDYQCPLLSLPLACNTNSVDKIPYQKQAYLWADPTNVQHWQQRMAKNFGSNKRRIGLVWASGHRPDSPHWEMMNLRSLHLRQLAPLATITAARSTQILSLQMEESAKQLVLLQRQDWDGPAMIDLIKDVGDWADTAALIANLDLVISTDTALAHLAASMGKPTWILLHHGHCWRWLQNRDDSPWYPNVRLFRQTTAGDWEGVVRRVVLALNELSN